MVIFLSLKGFFSIVQDNVVLVRTDNVQPCTTHRSRENTLPPAFSINLKDLSLSKLPLGIFSGTTLLRGSRLCRPPKQDASTVQKWNLHPQVLQGYFPKSGSHSSTYLPPQKIQIAKASPPGTHIPWAIHYELIEQRYVHRLFHFSHSFHTWSGRWGRYLPHS